MRLPPLRPPDLAPPLGRLDFRAAPFLALFLAPAFFPADLLPPDLDLAAFRPPEDLRAPALFPPEDLEGLSVAFLLVPTPEPDRGALVPLPVLRAGDAEPPKELRAPAPEVLPAAGALVGVVEGRTLPYPVPPLVDPGVPPPPSPPPVRDDSCRFPDPLGRPLLPLGAPPPKRSSSSSSS